MMGKEAALSGDLCACRCSPPPVMVASQSTMSQTFETHELASMGFAANGMPLKEESRGDFDELVRVVDGDGRSLCGVPFHIQTKSGTIHKGVTDENGHCPRVCTGSCEHLEIAIGIEAVKRWHA
ncbi:hypothetical protein [Cupriavidus pauculus]|nr:hypothetical protein [Cupriavidus pauculus]